MTNPAIDTLISGREGLVELSDAELDTLSGGLHQQKHHHRHHHGHGAISHSESDFFRRTLTISAQTTTGPNGTTTTFSIDLVEITSHSEQFQVS